MHKSKTILLHFEHFIWHSNSVGGVVIYIDFKIVVSICLIDVGNIGLINVVEILVFGIVEFFIFGIDVI